ncbi:MAG: UDP-N-acetylglucosamine--N-acetylmuramyl-(pentapeptide) pyrophosphoryl-undecaprenol N-acetylglucosamine transferase [Vampirovibrionales bacterium]|nr:UDP-N-acetylglucosamine--N-acetylmuramyl-(pentapeptide) pyrophosphoryl-undecaprenol N-acetylglucosamine transferase [Vampirovibrionales bacterium]
MQPTQPAPDNQTSDLLVNRARPFTVLLTGGGTGGHIYPALAVAEALKQTAKQRQIDLTLHYVGNAPRLQQGVPTPSLESRLATAQGLPFYSLAFSGMPRSRQVLAWAKWLYALPQAVFSAYQILSKTGAHCVFATGGYITAPVLMAAKLKGCPYFIHEPDARPGLVNRLMSRWARRVTVAFEAAIPALATPAERIRVTGNPIRDDIGALTQAAALARLGLPWIQDASGKAGNKPILLIMGGSQGAEKLNQAAIEAAPALLAMGVNVIHQTGQNKFETAASRLYNALRPSQAAPTSADLSEITTQGYWLTPYLQDIPAVLAAADLTVCRAGSLTLSELFAAGLPAVLVPYPYAAANHQWHNAQSVANAGAAFVLDDASCTGQTLMAAVEPLLQNPQARAQMTQAAKALACPGAAQVIAQQLLET